MHVLFALLILGGGSVCERYRREGRSLGEHLSRPYGTQRCPPPGGNEADENLVWIVHPVSPWCKLPRAAPTASGLGAGESAPGPLRSNRRRRMTTSTLSHEATDAT